MYKAVKFFGGVAALASALVVVATPGIASVGVDSVSSVDGTPIRPWLRDGTPIRPWLRDGTPIRPWLRDGTPIRPWHRDGTPIRPW